MCIFFFLFFCASLVHPIHPYGTLPKLHTTDPHAYMKRGSAG
jgi:hypothetical protein